jgi:rhodanese-related sulfurtransferase
MMTLLSSGSSNYRSLRTQPDFMLVETLDERQYEFAHLPGAINLPPGQVNRAQELIPDKNAEVVVYCVSPP